MRKAIFIACCLVSVVFASQVSEAQSIRVVGSTTVKVFVDLAAKQYDVVNSGVQVFVRGGGSGAAIPALQAGQADIGMLSRQPTAEEIAIMKKMDVQYLRVAMDAVVIAVSGVIYNAGIHALAHDKLVDIWGGKLRNWQALGGPDRPILVVSRENGSGTKNTFMKWLNAEQSERPFLLVMPSNLYTCNLLSASDQAIAYLPFGAVNEHMHAIALLINSKAIAPNEESIRSGGYPMRRFLYVAFNRDAPKYVHDFVQYLTSKQALPILRKAGYLPIK